MSSPNPQERSEQTRIRRALFARIAQMQAIKEEKDRREHEKSLPKNQDSYYNPWMDEQENEMWKRNQLNYTLQHKAEYEVNNEMSRLNIEASTSSNTEQRQQQPLAPVQEQEPSHQSTSGYKLGVGATTVRTDIIAQLKALRGGRICKRPGNFPVNDFDRTSTILQSTVLPADDFNTNIEAKELYDNYFANYRNNTDLPIYKLRSHIVNSINSYSVILIEGATGCGKTTQVPLYILEDAIKQRRCKQSPVIYVTQPRRIAARSIAERVCSEHGWQVGSIVGYQVSLDKKVAEQTVLVFCTAGVLLQKLIQEKTLKGFTHIIVDEAHERDADTDLLLMMIRMLMRKEMLFFRLIVMSATMDASKLRKYFTFRANFGHQALTKPSAIDIPVSRTSTNRVQVVMLDKLTSSFDVDLEGEMPEFDYENPELYDTCLRTAMKIIIDVIPKLDTFSGSSQSTLVFLPGYAEISKMDRMLSSIPNLNKHIDVVPLHSCLSVRDQDKIFQPARPGCRKVILATNIAESSITVPDVGFIIDFCLTKSLVKDNLTRFPTLKLQWSSQDKSIQRAGRTGRCCAGKVFRMVPYGFFEGFKKYADPELLTAPLELSVLRVKNFQMGELQALFAVVLDPPPFAEIRTAVLELKQIGALSSTYKGKISDIDGDITELGRVISALPIDVRLSKLIVLASVLDVIEGAIVVAACLSTNRTVVKHIYGNTMETYENKLEWSKGSHSDLFVSLDVFNEFKNNRDRGKTERQVSQWCRDWGLDDRKLYDVDALVSEIKIRLNQVNICIIEQPNRERDSNVDNLMLKVAFCAAFYPNYFVTNPFDVDYVKKDLCGMDPTKTVLMSNIPCNQVPLYRTQILKQAHEYVCENVDFIADCSRALLVLNEDTVLNEDDGLKLALGDNFGVLEPTRQVRKAVYRALKLGDTGEYIYIREFKELPAFERMRWYNEQRQRISQNFERRLLPCWYKIVDGAPNNERFDVSEEEFQRAIRDAYYLELEFNSKQDELDQHELYELEEYEEPGRKADHPIFKDSQRRIRGPDSPIRMTFTPLLERSRGFLVDIDPHSVNSLLLDPDYEKERRQLLVAASVTQTKKNHVMSRDTTLMPNIRGLPALMALLFAQYYKLIYNEKMKCLAAGVFGIGWDETGRPIDRLYEVEICFDVIISLDDIALINKARERISGLLRLTEIQNAGKPQAQLQHQLRDIILALIRKRRYPLINVDVSDFDLASGDYYRDENCEIVESRSGISSNIDQDMCPFLPIMKLSREYTELDTMKAIRANLDEMEKIRLNEVRATRKGIRCLVCGNGVKCFLLLYMNIVNHVVSQDHLDKVKEFEAYERLVLEREQSRQQQ